MKNLITEFENTWMFTRNMSLEFLKGVPSNSWHYSPHPKFAPLAKQARHLICVQGVYNNGFISGKGDFSKKHTYYSGTLDQTKIIPALENQKDELKQTLADIKNKGLDSFKIDFFGMSLGFAEYTYIILQHESTHHGQWSLYAALSGFETPKSWQSNWEL